MRVPLENIIINKAEPLILPQVKRFFRDHGFRPQAPKNDEIYIALLNKQLIGALRISPIDQYWLLRSMCIHENYRRQGIGQFMLEQIKPTLNNKQCFCFPYEHLEKFYQTVGFHTIDTSQAPDVIVEKFNTYIKNGKKIKLQQYSAAST